MKRRWKFVGGAVLVLLPLALLLALISTRPGLGLLIRMVNQAGGGLVTIGSASGVCIGPLELGAIVYDDGVDAVRIERLRLDWRPTELLRGVLRVGAVHGSGVRVDIGPGDGTPLPLPPFSLPLPLTIDTVTADRLAIFSEGDEVLTNGTGRIDNVAWQHQTIDLRSILLTTATAEVRARGQLRTETGYPLELHFDYNWAPEGYGRMTGKGVVRGPFDVLACEAEQATPFVARLTGTLLDLSATTTWTGRLTSERFALAEINRNWGRTRFAAVEIDGRGSLDDYSLQVGGRVTQDDFPDQWADLRAALIGNWEGLRVSDLHLARADAELTGKGRIGWEPFFTWQAEASASRFDPALFFPGWSGELQGQLWTEGGWDAAVDSRWRLKELHGTLRGFPVRAGGEALLQDSRLQVQDLVVTSGRSNLRLSGETGETMALTFQLVSDNLAELWPGATGRVDAQGTVAGSSAEPRVQVTLSGEGLGLDGQRVERLALDMDSVLSAKGPIGTTLKAEGVVLGEVRLDSVRTELQGTGRTHTLVLRAHGAGLSGEAHLRGGVTEQGWQGAVDQTGLSRPAGDAWGQQQPAGLTVNGAGVVLQPFCLVPATGGSLCLEGGWKRGTGAWQAHLTANDLPLAVLTRTVGAQWPLKGELTAALDLAGEQARLLAGRLDASTSGMELFFAANDRESPPLRWRRNTLQGDFTDGRIRVGLDSELEDGGTLQMELVQPGVRLPGTDLLTHPVTGSARWHWRNLAPLTALTEGELVLSGAVQGEVLLSGAITAPQIAGTIDLQDGQADIPRLGITLSPLQLHLHGEASQLRLAASARSGEGALRAESILDLTRGKALAEANLRVTGSDFLAVDLPGLEVVLSPDLNIAREQDRARITGSILIPRARIATIDLERGVAPSADVVVIDDEGRGQPMAANWPMHAVVKVTAGDNVQVDTRGLRGRVTGELEVTAVPNRPQVGRGALNVQEGSFTLYGRRLSFDVGRLLFAGGPLINPGIELRSEKKENGVTVGMVAEGFLNRPEIRLYSHPYMDQSAILTRLMESTSLGGSTRKETGFLGEAVSMVGLGGVVPYLQGLKELTRIDDIRLETGQGSDALSLVLGSWLTPDFYVSYGKNLLNESGSFNTRYLLGKGFSIKTETGSSQSGGDIKYEFEH